jgi:hypothetical protein
MTIREGLQPVIRRPLAIMSRRSTISGGQRSQLGVLGAQPCDALTHLAAAAHDLGAGDAASAVGPRVSGTALS